MKQIDYYNYWNKKRKKSFFIWDRERLSLRLLDKIIKRNDSVLDVGCSNGRFMKIILERFSEKNIRLQGADYSKTEVNEAKKEGLDVKLGNLENGLNFRDKTFDVIYAGEVIEHLYNPDFFLSEMNRALKAGGHLVFSTPNLCAWFNRVLMPLGMQPLFLEPSTKSKLVGAGFLAKFKKESQPVGHVRIFTIGALKDMLKMNGFELVKIRGALFDEGLPKGVLWLDRLFSLVASLSSNLVVVARKIS